MALFDPLPRAAAGAALAAVPGARRSGSRSALRVRFRRAREATSALTSRIQETLAGIRVIKAYGAEAREQRALRGREPRAPSTPPSTRAACSRRFLVGALLGGRRRRWRAAGAFAALRTWRGDVASRVAALGFTVWNLGLFNFVKARFGDGAGQLRALFRTWGRDAGHRDRPRPRVRAARSRARGAATRPDAVALAAAPARRRASATSHFRYAADRPALEGVDFEARVGTITAIVGPTGSGKSTLMALLLRLFEPDRGAIEIDGVDLRALRDREPARARSRSRCRRTCSSAPRSARTSATPCRDASDAAVREAARVAARRRVHRAPGAGLRHAARRARHEALDRPAPAPLDRARRAEGHADPGARRADRLARRRDRAARAAEPRGVGHAAARSS